MFAVKTISILAVLVLMWRENIAGNFLFVLPHREPLSAGLSDSLRKEEVRLINVRRDINAAHLFVRKSLSLPRGRQQQRVQENCVTFSSTDEDLSQHCLETVSCWFVVPCKTQLNVTSRDGGGGKYGALMENSPSALNVKGVSDETLLHLHGYIEHSNTNTTRM